LRAKAGRHEGASESVFRLADVSGFPAIGVSAFEPVGNSLPRQDADHKDNCPKGSEPKCGCESNSAESLTERNMPKIAVRKFK